MSRVQQLSLLNDMPYIDDNFVACEYCGELVDINELVDVFPDGISICNDCAENIFMKHGYVRCPSCHSLNYKVESKDDPDFIHNFCEYCGSLLEDDD